MSKKQEVLKLLFNKCKKENNYVFNSEDVKKISQKVKFGNPFDVTKIDNLEKLPDILKDEDYAVIHLGSGKHQFIKGINKVYHKFEKIDKIIEWKYKKSLLNEFNSSESNILSVANNQRILHDFLFNGDLECNNIEICKRSKTYFPHRTKTSFDYSFGNDLKVELKNIQIEIDLTIELNGNIAVFEAKNGSQDNFAIYQIYHPFLYYFNSKNTGKIKENINEIYCIYVTKTILNGITNLNFWSYTFENPKDITSIKFIKSVCYKLII